jgi:ATPase subunit of ABC transporter with duplicated ATPase domains
MSNTSLSKQAPLLELVNIKVTTPTGRPLFDDLNMSLNYEKVVIIGRNRVGKSTRLQIMSGNLQPQSGKVINNIRPLLVEQTFSSQNNSNLNMRQKEFQSHNLSKRISRCRSPNSFIFDAVRFP